MEINKEFLIKLYKEMLRIRIFEESLVDPILDGTIKTPCHLYSGQEAIAVGVCQALNHEDVVFGNHRSHGHYLAKGGDMNALMAEIYGKETGCSKGRGGSMHIIDTSVGFMGATPIVAGTVSLAVGAAMAFKIRKENRIAVSFFGDGAIGEGVVYESLNFAMLHKLPIIFVCENNKYVTHMKTENCVANEIVDQISGFGINKYWVDGNDVKYVYNVVKDNKQYLPLFLECYTYRLRGHVGPDDNIQGIHKDIRPKEEIEEWKKYDLIKMLREKIYPMTQDFMTEDSILYDIYGEVENKVKEAHEFAKNSHWPSPNTLEDYVYA